MLLGAVRYRSNLIDVGDNDGSTADAIKAEVPIWKEQELANGSTQWVGLE